MPDPTFMEITKALADESRVRALLALRHGELCVCQIIGLLGLAPSTISKHLAILKQAGLIDARKHGRWMYYRIADHDEPQVRATLDWLSGTIANSPAIRDDDRRLRNICKIDPEILCEQQREGIWAACLTSTASCSSARTNHAAARSPKAGRAASTAAASRRTARALSPPSSTRSPRKS